MKKKTEKFAVALLAAGTMMITGLTDKADASYYYKADEATGIEQNIEAKYGKVKQVKYIFEDGKDNRGSFNDDIVQTIYVNDEGLETKVTVRNLNGMFGPEKIIERTVDGKKIVEEFSPGREKDSWNLSTRVIEYDLNDANISEWYNGESPDGGLNLRTTLVERKTEDGKNIEYHWGKPKYYEGKKPDAMDIIKETTIYPKGTTIDDSREYYMDQKGECPKEDFFYDVMYDSIERKKIETMNTDGSLERVRYVTRVKYYDKEDYEVRIEQDYDISRRPNVDGKFEFFRSTIKTRDGVYDKIDYDGDGIPDEEVRKKIVTINFE